jgi:hypothetical protein
MKSEVVGRQSVVSGDRVQNVDQIIWERQRFTISELSYESTNFTHCSLRDYQS